MRAELFATTVVVLLATLVTSDSPESVKRDARHYQEQVPGHYQVPVPSGPTYLTTVPYDPVQPSGSSSGSGYQGSANEISDRTVVKPKAPSTPIKPGRAYAASPPVTVPPVPANDHKEPEQKPDVPITKEESQWTKGTVPYVLEKLGFSSFIDLFILAGVDSLIEKEGPITVFVAPDQAFEALSNRFGGTEKALEQFDSQPELLVSLLKGHIVPGILPAELLVDNYVGSSLLGTPLRVKHYEAEDHEWRPIRVVTVNGARVVQTSIPATNGLIHILDRPLFPAPVADIYNTLRKDPEQRFKILLSAIELSGLGSILGNPYAGPFTLFAPTDKAFSYLSASELQLLFADPVKLSKLLQRHVVKDLIYTSGLQGFQKAYALDYELLYIYHKKGMTKINGANVVDQDFTTLNGVIHSIDSVLGRY